APEQAWGRIAEIDVRTDVFGLGGILYEILTLQPPYASTRPLDLLRAARSGQVRPPATVVTERVLPAGLCDITMRALARDPADRYQKVRELREAIEAFVRGGGWFATQRFVRGAMIIREGEPGDVAYLLTAGRCEVFRMVDGARHVLRVVGPGEVVGEVALVTRAPRNAHVEAMTDVTALVITRPALDEELARASWMRVFVDAAVHRFASLDQEYATVTRRAPA
ncbi:MAG: cyclic nucleotide-binding domain-containing protein, partial [Candidatus Binatia bacterium]